MNLEQGGDKAHIWFISGLVENAVVVLQRQVCPEPQKTDNCTSKARMEELGCCCVLV